MGLFYLKVMYSPDRLEKYPRRSPWGLKHHYYEKDFQKIYGPFR